MIEKGLLLDTSFILPIFGIDVSFGKNFRNDVKSLLKYGINNHRIIVSSISLIEVMFKLNREYRKQIPIKIRINFENIE